MEVIIKTNESLNGAVCRIEDVGISLQCCNKECSGGFSTSKKPREDWKYSVHTSADRETATISCYCPKCAAKMPSPIPSAKLASGVIKADIIPPYTLDVAPRPIKDAVIDTTLPLSSPEGVFQLLELKKKNNYYKLLKRHKEIEIQEILNSLGKIDELDVSTIVSNLIRDQQDRSGKLSSLVADLKSNIKKINEVVAAINN